MELRGKVVGTTEDSGAPVPPLHPRCRCTIIYNEIEPARALRTNKPQIDLLPAVGGGDGSVQNNLLNAVPKGVGLCKSFDEIKLYWAGNYNVKVVDEIGKLNFEAVRAAMSGVEAVLEEFPQAGSFLKEFDVFPSDLMSTWRGHGKIYFNPEIFSGVEKVAAVILAGVESGVYPKNMTVVGAGAHEAGHIVEDWLIKKFRSVHTEYRPVPRRLTYEAYQNAIVNPEGKGKSFKKLQEEIAIYATHNPSECLSSAISDYVTNANNAAILSKTIWQRLKEELSKMLLPNEVKLAKFSIEEYEKYGVFDNEGWIVGVKENAPDEFKEAYEWDKKKNEDRWKLGID